MTEVLKTTEMYCVVVLEARSSECQGVAKPCFLGSSWGGGGCGGGGENLHCFSELMFAEILPGLVDT